MGRLQYSEWWRSSVVDALRSYSKLQTDDSDISKLYRQAIDKAIEDTKKMPNGETILKIIEMRYFSGRYTLEGVAYTMNYSTRNIIKLSNKFIFAVARNVAHIDTDLQIQ